jgi:hypothetical protein
MIDMFNQTRQKLTNHMLFMSHFYFCSDWHFNVIANRLTFAVVIHLMYPTGAAVCLLLFA